MSDPMEEVVDDTTEEPAAVSDPTPVPAPIPVVPPAPAPPPARERAAPSPAPARRAARDEEDEDERPSRPREKTFSQADLDAAIGKARTEGRAAAYRYLGKELGVPVVAEDGTIELSGLRTLVEEARTKRASNEDALRSTLDKLTEVEGRYSEKEAEIVGAIGRARHELRRGEAKALAIQTGFSDYRDALALLGDLGRFEADLETGSVTGLEDALKEIAAQKPYLLRQATDAPPPPAIPPTPSPADGKELMGADDDRRQAVRRQAETFF